ncbi:MAG: hypothetical protein BWY94_01562 [Actinobacteria bacterium ADurb.BinA094]|nr:MAG: hypothetical protein BWY94_01562 [Actinobacteria bacterium ADurb.BinA094]
MPRNGTVARPASSYGTVTVIGLSKRVTSGVTLRLKRCPPLVSVESHGTTVSGKWSSRMENHWFHGVRSPVQKAPGGTSTSAPSTRIFTPSASRSLCVSLPYPRPPSGGPTFATTSCVDSPLVWLVIVYEPVVVTGTSLTATPSAPTGSTPDHSPGAVSICVAAPCPGVMSSQLPLAIVLLVPHHASMLAAWSSYMEP